jgi:hypothetical protein
MGIDVQLESELGISLESLGDSGKTLATLLPPFEDESFHLLRYIDPYGDTVFNHLQMDEFLAEWDRLRQNAITEPQKEFHAAVRRIAESCKNNVHTYVKFIGD